MNQDIVITPTLSIPATELEWQFARSSGPGGQNVNKVNSKAVLRWRMQETVALSPVIKQRFRLLAGNRITKEGDFLLACDEYRDQPRNIARCQHKLRELVLAAMRPEKKRIPTKPSRASQRRRVDAKKLLSQKKSFRKFSQGD